MATLTEHEVISNFKSWLNDVHSVIQNRAYITPNEYNDRLTALGFPDDKNRYNDYTASLRRTLDVYTTSLTHPLNFKHRANFLTMMHYKMYRITQVEQLKREINSHMKHKAEKTLIPLVETRTRLKAEIKAIAMYFESDYYTIIDANVTTPKIEVKTPNRPFTQYPLVDGNMIIDMCTTTPILHLQNEQFFECISASLAIIGNVLGTFKETDDITLQEAMSQQPVPYSATKHAHHALNIAKAYIQLLPPDITFDEITDILEFTMTVNTILTKIRLETPKPPKRSPIGKAITSRNLYQPYVNKIMQQYFDGLDMLKHENPHFIEHVKKQTTYIVELAYPHTTNSY